MRIYQKLQVWQDAMTLVEIVYRVTKLLPREEQFGLSSQMRRAAVSIPSNIAEGRGRETDKEFIRFLYISRGSLMELETQIAIAKQLDYLENDEELFIMTHKLYAKLQSLINALK